MTDKNRATALWAAVLAALVALFAALGFGSAAARTASPAAEAAGTAGTAGAPAVVPVQAARRERVRLRRTWREVMRGRSLPPTIAQRIRAEAHGSSPSVRRSTTAAANGLGVAERVDSADVTNGDTDGARGGTRAKTSARDGGRTLGLVA
ncbi:DUF6344 domain-containing protein [Streptomyces sp. NPDC097619]|uniref:DUF6344 domain-containing protein n=1 Tax=Streptomyces sp. NPDC097619 TaxID=3157228 RepID=UPI00332050EC